MSDPSIIPNPGLITEADPASGNKTKFALFSDSWIEMQGYVGAALELPLGKDDFENKYGSLGNSQIIKDCIGAMKDVKEASAEFGDPKSLRAALIENPDLLATEKPPQEIYTHTVWLGQKVHKTAQTLVSGYESVYEGLIDLPPREQVENLKAYLFDQTMGPIPLSEKMAEETRTLIKKLGTFEQKMNEYNEKLQAYTKNSSAMISEVDRTIGEKRQKILDLERLRDEAYKAWRDFTIAAVTTSVGVALIGGLLAPFTGGVSLLVGGVAGLALGVGLGIKAATCRAQYNVYCDQISKESVELQKKTRLRSDLGDFDVQMQRVAPAMAGFLKNLQTIEGVWVGMNNDLVTISNEITLDNVGTMPFLVKAKAKLAIDSWKAIDESAKQFTVQSLVDYTSIAFGDKMPENISAAA